MTLTSCCPSHAANPAIPSLVLDIVQKQSSSVGQCLAFAMESITQPSTEASTASVFQIGCEVPPITLGKFGMRLDRYCQCSLSCFVVAWAYLTRIRNTNPELFHTSNLHKLMLASLTIAAKYCDDITCTQKYYAQCGGVTVAELNCLEMELLKLIDFRAHVNETEFRQSNKFLTLVRDTLQAKAPH
eukprot:c10337_g1_i1.p1 GENE.c10337_g1_i1~~c10337_g1_i1.p1  ORF type:complete len:186 (+),score=23.07 c10337_g1_i1:116-673(+)